ncbi:MAG TPA: CBS domain-containing protein [Longimicrobiales bacterium]|nr:CBS domain-containing protein [Longimicrobiales bacterium]
MSDALALMREHRVRRLPVVEEGRLVGIVSMNDLVLGAAPTAGKAGRPTFKEVMHSLQGICAHRPRPQ